MAKKEDILKIVSIGLIVVLVVNAVLFAMGIIPVLNFWIIIAVIALIAYKGMPLLKKS